MNLNPQIIKKNGMNEFVVIPFEEYVKIQQALEDYEDLLDLRKAKADTVNEPSIPFTEIEKKYKANR